MTPGRRLLAGGLILLAAALLALGWLSRNSFQRLTESEDTGLQGEALENRTLLLQKWLEAGGRPVLRRGGELLARDLPRDGTLILLHLSQPVTEMEAATLLAWVRGGGHLLTDGSPAPFNDERGLAVLHRHLGVTLRDRTAPSALGAPEFKRPGKDQFGDQERPYRVWRSAKWRLVPDRLEDWPLNLGSEGAQVLLSRPEGAGRITLTPDLGFVYGEALAQDDHAAYLERLLAPKPGPGPVVVWSRPMDTSLLAWVWAHGRASLLALGLLLAAWAWGGWGRFGPLLPAPPVQRRSLLEHLSASARQIWWEGSGAYLVACARERLERRAQRLNPGYGALDLGGRADWLARATGAHADAIGSALDDRPGREAHRLAQDLITLVRLRQRL